MMRLWMVDPKLMCRRHLCGEHVECHMFVGTIIKNISIRGYINKGLLEVHNLQSRHNDLAREMLARNYHHESPLPGFESWHEGCINIEANLIELARRCPECRNRIKLYNGKE